MKRIYQGYTIEPVNGKTFQAGRFGSAEVFVTGPQGGTVRLLGLDEAYTYIDRQVGSSAAVAPYGARI